LSLQTKINLLYIGGEDVRMRIPILKKMRGKGYLVSAVGCNDTDAFKDKSIPYFDYYLNRSISPLQDIRSKRQLRIIFQKERPNLIHLFDTKPGVLTPKVAKKSGVKFVIRTITGMGFIFSSNSFFVKALRPFYRLIQKRAIRYTNSVIFQNSDDKEYFEKYNLVSKNKSYLVTSSGLDVDSFISSVSGRNILNELRDNLGFKSNDVVITLIARLVKDKGVEEFLKAAKMLSVESNVKFLLVGPRSSEGSQAVSESVISEYIDYVNYIGPSDNVSDLLSISDVFVLPTYYREGLPRILLEAGALGLPLITTDMPGCKDVVRHNWNGFLVPTRDFEALADSIKKLINNPELRKSMGEKNPKFIKENFDLSIVANAYDKIYQNLLDK
jgi:glycosyltransferase involved in cell wall biosynthesis